MASSYWSRRWISRREINEKKKWASAWRSNPERMKLAQAKATRTAQVARERHKQVLLSFVSSDMPREAMETHKLKATLVDFLKRHKKRYTRKDIKALTVRLSRYGVLRFDPVTLLWSFVL